MTTTSDNTRQQRPRLALRAVGDLADTFDPDLLAVMHRDAVQLARAGRAGAGGWQALADALGAACAIARHERQAHRG